MPEEAVLEVRDLLKTYGETRALDGVSFLVQPGEVFGMLGPNGAGKTTCIECIEGLREADGGAITVLGMKQGADRQRIKSRVGLQLQTTGLFPKLTVLELLRLFATFYPRPLPVSHLIEMVDLKEKKGTRSKDLSGGQRQRLSLALALVGDPELVFLDEPTTGLDPQARRALWDVVGNLKGKGKTVMLTTHYMEEAEQLCDRVAIMDHGKLIEMDRPSALIARHFEEAAIEFNASAGWPTELVSGLPGVKNVASQGSRLVVYSRDVPRTMAALFELGSNRGLDLEEITVRSASLEDVFLKLTGRRIRE